MSRNQDTVYQRGNELLSNNRAKNVQEPGYIREEVNVCQLSGLAMNIKIRLVCTYNTCFQRELTICIYVQYNLGAPIQYTT